MASSDGGSSLSLSLFFLLLVPACAAQAPPKFRCSKEHKCQAMAGFVPQTETTYKAIKELFQVGSIYDLYGANGLNETTPASTKVPVNATVRIPFPCACANGTGVSDRKPIYTTENGDSLKKIAGETFGGLVTDLQIAGANGIVNASSPVDAGKRLLIPLPCSCDDLNSSPVVHLAHVVREETSLAEITDKFSVFRESLIRFNDVPNSNSLVAGQVLDVPLDACTSFNIRPASPDSPLYVANGSYALTANNCIKCSCNVRRTELYCYFSPDSVENKAPGCPSETCYGEYPYKSVLTLGTLHISMCYSEQCLYAGFDKRLIWTAKETLRDTGCEYPPPPPFNCVPSPGPTLFAGTGLSPGWTLLLLLLLSL